jgi:AcrR family transcriptional regulator
MSVKSLRAQHAEATRSALIDTARKLFLERGYARVSADEICRDAGVTRGAMYHHFKDKRDLFGEVCDQISRELTERLGEAGLARIADDPWGAITSTLDAFLDACVEGDFARLVILEGPAIAGWDEWREHAQTHEVELMETGLRIAMDAGLIAAQPVRPLGFLLLGAMNEAAMLIARAPDRKKERDAVGDALRTIWEGLRIDT